MGSSSATPLRNCGLAGQFLSSKSWVHKVLRPQPASANEPLSTMVAKALPLIRFAQATFASTQSPPKFGFIPFFCICQAVSAWSWPARSNRECRPDSSINCDRSLRRSQALILPLNRGASCIYRISLCLPSEELAPRSTLIDPQLLTVRVHNRAIGCSIQGVSVPTRSWLSQRSDCIQSH